jgi:hypothetical protein
MPRYYFHLCNAGGHFIEDEVGVELADMDAAQREAVLTAESFEADREVGGFDYSGYRFEIASADGRQKLNVPAFVRGLVVVSPRLPRCRGHAGAVEPAHWPGHEVVSPYAGSRRYLPDRRRNKHA